MRSKGGKESEVQRGRVTCPGPHSKSEPESSWPPPTSGTPNPVPLPPKIPEEQVGIGLEVLNGGRVHKAEAEDWWGWGSTEHTHDAGREGHGQLPSYSSKAAGGGGRVEGFGHWLILILPSPSSIAACGSPESARP